MADTHQPFIKTPRQLIVVVVLAFVIPVAVGIMLTQLFTGGGTGMKESESAVLARIKPVGEVVIAEASGPKGQMAGEQVFNQVCKTCHEAGLAGAPKVGDKASWSKVVAQGQKTAVQHAISGIRAMPPKGGNPDLADVEVERAVVFMANQVGANWKEPPAPTNVAAAPGAAAPGAVAPGAAMAGAAGTSSPPQSASAKATGTAGTATTPVTPPPAPAAAPAAATASASASVTGTAAKPDGKKIYDTVCMACHSTGAAGAPKLGDKAAWAARIKNGIDALHANAIKGKGAMPPKGGNASLSDADVNAAVDYIVSASK
jgi:cytochrome c5